MEELVEAERKQERQVNALIRSIPISKKQPPRVLCLDRIDEIEEEAEVTSTSNVDDSDDSADDDYQVEYSTKHKRPLRSPPPEIFSNYFNMVDPVDQRIEGSELALKRCPSRAQFIAPPPPELTDDEDDLNLSDLEDEDPFTSLPLQFCLPSLTQKASFPKTVQIGLDYVIGQISRAPMLTTR